MKKLIHPTEMSPAENDYEMDLEDITSTIAETETSQAENDHEKELENDHDQKELEHLTSTIAEKIDEGAKKTESFFSSACIYRVSEDLRKLNESAYTPHLIAIGPLHREDKHLQTPLQHVKMSYTKYLLNRLTVATEDLELAKQTKLMVLQKCLAEMKTLVGDAKKCYAAEVTVLDEEMMLVDGCFILEYLYRSRSRSIKDRAEEKWNKPIDGGDNGNSKEQENADPIFGNHGMTAYNIDFDLVLLENQIPFFVLEKLFQLTIAQIPNRSDKNWLLIDYVLGNYSYMMRPAEGSSSTSNNAKNSCLPRDCVLRVLGDKLESSPIASEEEEDQSSYIDHRNVKYYHILHAIHDACVPHEQIETKKLSHIDRELEVVMPSASNLAYAGVKFVPGNSDNLFKVQFTEPESLFWWYHRARFEIPALEILDATESSFRNLIAFEQNCPGVSQHVSCYAHLWNVLVNSNKDVQLLEKAGVLRNYLGAPDDATDLFNKLDKEVLISGDYFADTYIKATLYSKRFWPKHVAALRRTYFASPWTFIAFCVGFVAFVMSSVEFIRGFLKKG